VKALRVLEIALDRVELVHSSAPPASAEHRSLHVERAVRAEQRLAMPTTQADVLPHSASRPPAYVSDTHNTVAERRAFELYPQDAQLLCEQRTAS